MAAEPDDITRILTAAGQGDRSAVAKLIPMVYDQMRELARQKLAHEPAGLTLQPTALVNEAYLRLVGSADTPIQFENRRHFFGAAALAMRRILIERARAVAGPKRGGSWTRVALDSVAETPVPHDDLDWLTLNDAIAALETEDPDLAEIVNLRYFAGLSIEAVAQVLGTSSRTINRDWGVARAFLFDHITRTREA